jgi:hypothetical protein
MRKLIISAGMMPLMACATTMDYFAKNRTTMSQLQVCESALSAERNQDAAYINLARHELNRRNLSQRQCQGLIDQRNQTIAAIALVGAAAYVAGSQAGSGGGYTAQTQDTQWDWDQFRDQYGRFTWRCRGVQTGQFAQAYRCNGRARIDSVGLGK